MKKQFLFIMAIASFLVPTAMFAQAWGYDNNRIAISADGNNQPDNAHKWPKADPDDWGGTPAALTMLAKAGLRDKLVHYSYNNFIDAPAHTTAINHMKLGADGAIENWDFDSTLFFDVSANNDTAIKHLAYEMKKSTAVDPLYFIHMGPAEFFYRAVKNVVDAGSDSVLAHVYVISHSGYNNNHLRRGDPDFDITPVATEDKHHTLAETITLSGDRIKLKQIKDQNGSSDPNALWASDSDFSVWHWIRDHSDPKVQWLYERMLVNEKGVADISDAGMVFYLLTGDENGSPSKFETFIGSGVPGCGGTVTLSAIHDFANIDIDGFVPAYRDSSRNALAVDASQYQEEFAAAIATFSGEDGEYIINLTTKKETDGESTYRLRIAGELIGEFQNPETTVDMELYTYSFGRIAVKNGDTIQVEFNSTSNGKIPEGNEFAFARGRWTELEFECPQTVCEISEVGGLLVIEAESFPLAGDWKLVEDSKAAGGSYIHFTGPNYYQTPNDNHSMEIKFKIQNPGTYVAKWFMRQPTEAEGDKSNDAWIDFPDAKQIETKTGTTITGFHKFVGRSKTIFSMNGNVEVHGIGEAWLNVLFEEAGEYTLRLSARSELLQLDRLVLFKGISFEEAERIAKISDETTSCDKTLPIDPQTYYSTYRETVIKKTTYPIVIDGDYDPIWNSIINLKGNFDCQGRAAVPASDISYTFKIAYDDDFFYTIVNVKDDVKFMHLRNDNLFFFSDNVEILFNPDNVHESDGVFGNDAIQIRMNYGFTDNNYSGNGTWKGDAAKTGFEYISKDTDDGYIIEGKIPWAGIFGSGYSLIKGKKIGFEFMVGDSDKAGTRDNQIVWANDTENDVASKDTRVYGHIILDDVVELTAINNTEKQKINAFPNPVNNKLYISGISVGYKIDIVSINGTIIKSLKSSMEDISIDLKELPNGIYFVQIQTKNTSETLKFIKK